MVFSFTIIRNDEMLNQVQHDDGGESNIALICLLRSLMGIKIRGVKGMAQ